MEAIFWVFFVVMGTLMNLPFQPLLASSGSASSWDARARRT